MSTTTHRPGTKLKEQLAIKDEDQSTIRLIDQYLANKEERFSNEKLLKPLYELMIDENGYSDAKWLLQFLLGLEYVMLQPECAKHFYELELMTEKGANLCFHSLKKCMSALNNPEATARLYKVGLLTDSKRFKGEWNTNEEIEKEIASFK